MGDYAVNKSMQRADEKYKSCLKLVSMNNDVLSVCVVPQVGANLLEIRDRRSGRCYLRSPKTSYELDEFMAHPQLYGHCLLFPPNRLRRGQLPAGANTYRLPVNTEDGCHIHGILLKKRWRSSRIYYRSGAPRLFLTAHHNEDDDSFAFFPFTFDLRMRVSLIGNSVVQATTVINQSRMPLPLGVGFHTNLSVKGPSAGASVLISDVEQWTVNDTHLPTGDVDYENTLLEELRLGQLRTERRRLSDILLKDSAPGVPHRAFLTNAVGEVRVEYRKSRTLPFWVLWNGDGKSGFVSIEPQSWAIDAPNLFMPRTRTGMVFLRPGEQWRSALSLHFPYA